MQVRSDYFNAYDNLKLTRDNKGVLVADHNLSVAFQPLLEI